MTSYTQPNMIIIIIRCTQITGDPASQHLTSHESKETAGRRGGLNCLCVNIIIIRCTQITGPEIFTPAVT